MATWRRRFFFFGFVVIYVASLDLDISAAVHLIANVYYTLLFVLPRHLHGLCSGRVCPRMDIQLYGRTIYPGGKHDFRIIFEWQRPRR